MQYKGYTVTVSVAEAEAAPPQDPTFTIFCEGVLVHEGRVRGNFGDCAAAEDAAYSAAREWIEAKCRVN